MGLRFSLGAPGTGPRHARQKEALLLDFHRGTEDLNPEIKILAAYFTVHDLNKHPLPKSTASTFPIG